MEFEPATFRIVLKLTPSQMQALSARACLECRDARAEARYLLLRALGILPDLPPLASPPPPLVTTQTGATTNA